MNAPLRLDPVLWLVGKLEQSQWWTAERLARGQLRQLGALLAHAAETVPFYRERFAGVDARAPLTDEGWAALPVLTRRDIQNAGSALRSGQLPEGHGRTYSLESSGSTGQPVKVVGSGRSRLYWRALTLRDHLWHGRDLHGKLCSIRLDRSGRAQAPRGALRRGWGRATDSLGGDGAMALLALGTDVSVQAGWLRSQDPHYLLSFPSNLVALAEHFVREGLALPRLREVRTIGETLTPSAVERIRAAWDVPVVDLYSCEEAGVIAIPCPSGSGLYHVQCESLRVEVLDENGRACAPGEIGRVVVSTLHNFAMPLLRYDLRDYAELGAPCPCGRGLPTLARILGRRRNMLVLPNGERRWPLTGYREYRDIAPIRQYQLVQLDRSLIEARLVCDRAVTAEEEQRLAAVIRRWLGHPFELRFSYLDSFPPTPGGKFEDFVSLTDN